MNSLHFYRSIPQLELSKSYSQVINKLSTSYQHYLRANNPTMLIVNYLYQLAIFCYIFMYQLVTNIFKCTYKYRLYVQ